MGAAHELDLLAVAAHPDDAELGCGGTLALAAHRGLRAGILDLTRGELASRGDPETRAREAEAASAHLGLACRRNAGLPDGGLDPRDAAQRLAVVRLLRDLRPRLLLLPWTEARHPDHRHAALLAGEAAFRAGLHRVATGQIPFRPARILHYMERVPFEPTLVVDVTPAHEAKMRAIRAHRSQFGRAAGGAEGEGEGGGAEPAGGAPETFLTRPGFLEGIEARSRHYGELSGFRHGEPFRAPGPLPVRDLESLLDGGEA